MNHSHKVQEVAQLILGAFKAGTVPAALAQVFIRHNHLLDLEVWTAPDARETLLAVVEDAGAEDDRSALEAIVAKTSRRSALALELIDRPAFKTVERLIALGVLRFAAEDRLLLHRSPALGSETDAQRNRDLTAARDRLAQSERKIRMAAVLAGGGFPVALPVLREGVELSLGARAAIEGVDLPDAEKLPEAWIEARLPAHLPLVRTLRNGSEVLLGATAAEVSGWISAAEKLAREVGDALRRFEPPSRSAQGPVIVPRKPSFLSRITVVS